MSGSDWPPNLSTIIEVLGRELEAAGSDPASGADVQIVGANSLTARARRGLLVGCRIVADTVDIASDSLAGLRMRLPDPARDSLMIWVPSDSSGPEGWVPVALLGSGIGAACPSGEGAVRYPATIDSTTVARIGPSGRSILILFESINARAYLGAGGWQFGIEGLSAGATVQPIAGRLVGAGGLDLVGLDRLGVPLAGPGPPSAIGVIVVAESYRGLAVGGGRVAPVRDSARAILRFRNAP